MICKTCGEEWELDAIHEAIKEESPGLSETLRRADGRFDQDRYEREHFTPMLARFRKDGCRALDPGARYCQPATTAAATSAIAMQAMAEDLLGDDVDGIEAMMEDWA